MIYFALTVLALKTTAHALEALGVEFKKKTEGKEPSKLVRFWANSFFVVAYGYILFQFITLK